MELYVIFFKFYNNIIIRRLKNNQFNVKLKSIHDIYGVFVGRQIISTHKNILIKLIERNSKM